MTVTTSMEGKKLVYSETFPSPFEKDTKGDALNALDDIRRSHPSEDGWVEIFGGVEQLPNGKWRAYRTHQKFE